MKTIENEFGQKIGGSRRDLWKSRGLNTDDLFCMNDAEKNKFVTKNNIWPKPDYQAMKEDGQDTAVIYFKKIARDAAAVKPLLPDFEEYTQTMCDYRDAVMALRAISDCLGFFRTFLVGNGYCCKDGYYYRCSKSFSCIGGAKIFKAVANVTEQKLRWEVKKKSFLYTEDEKYLAEFAILQKGPYEAHVPDGAKNPMIKRTGGYYTVFGLNPDEFNSMDESDWFIMTARQNFVACGFSSKEEAIRYLLAKKEEHTQDAPAAQAQSKKKKGRFIPKQLSSFQRLGPDRILAEDEDVTGQDYLDRYHFFGGEFGNWMTEADRQVSLNMGYQAFHDLALALGIPDDEIAFRNNLSIAFGARGKGAACAHYEPLRQVINLTKLKGAGSLAHEYGHALDDMLSKKSGNQTFFSESLMRQCPESFCTLLFVMKNKKVEKTFHASDSDKAVENYLRSLKSSITVEFCKASKTDLENLISVCDSIAAMRREDIIRLAKNLSPESTDDAASSVVIRHYVAFFNQAKASMVVRAKKMRKETEKQVSILIQMIISSRFVPETEVRTVMEKTDFYKNSCKFDNVFSKEGKGYWSSDVELFARAFACYIQDRLSSLGIRNDYLTGHAESCVLVDEDGSLICAYPQGEERNAINEAMALFLQDMKDKGLL